MSKKTDTPSDMSTTLIDYKLTELGELLRTHSLKVPRFQRDYSWERENVLALLDDFGGAISRSEKQYFLGSIVLTLVDGDELEIVDGQQRLATTFMILCAIRNWFTNREDSDRAGLISSKYIASVDLGSTDIRPKLSLNALDHSYFENRVINNDDDVQDAEKPSHERIDSAAQLIENRVNEIASSAGTAAVGELVKWVTFTDKSTSAIRVTVPDHATAFTIFETLNDRGLPLAIADLLKNFLFAQAGARMNEAEAAWLKMIAHIEAIGDPDAPTDFIRHFWSSYHGLVRAKDIFKQRIES